MIREPHSNPIDSTSAISTACDAILQISKNTRCTTVVDKSARSQAPTLNEACQAAVRVWSAIVSNLEVGKNDSCARLEFVSLAIPISSVVRCFLGQLRQHCLNEAERRRKKSPVLGSSEVTNLKRCLGDVSNEVEPFEYNTKVLTRFLVHIMSTAARLHARHQQIFDAIASVFLQHVGESMGLHLFGDSANNCATDHAVPIPGVSKASSTGVNYTRFAAQIEAPHLIEVLRPFVKTLVPEELGCTAFKVVENLQKTLMQGVFGSGDERLPLPINSVELVELNAVDNTDFELADDEDSKDWFLTQVWELLGWDILVG